MSNLNPVFEGIINNHFPKKVEDAEVVECKHLMNPNTCISCEDEKKEETWRDKEVREHLYTMERNSQIFWEWLEWCDVVKGYNAKKIIAIGRNFTEYVDLYHEFLKDWYKTDIRESNF
tara:strand:- start:89 stop:442 length:354 start_codon:yes stop_codon:yes gene_type:complete